MKKIIAVLVVAVVIALGIYQYAKQDPLLSMALGINNSEQSAAAYREFIKALIDMEELVEKNPAASAEGYRHIMHLLESSLSHTFEEMPAYPEFKRVGTTTVKMLGDNPDAVYYRTAINPTYRYRISGRMAGAKYFSISVHDGSGNGYLPEKISRVISSDELTIDSEGNFAFNIGTETDNDAANAEQFQISTGAVEVLVRFYFEEKQYIANDVWRHVPLDIKNLDNIAAPAAPNDASIAEAIRRSTRYFTGHIRLLNGPRGDKPLPAFVSIEPNILPLPVKPGNMALANADAAYSQAPFVLQDHQALIMRGKMPDARTVSVVLWNAFLQSFDYRYRPTSLNRKQLQLEDEGGFTIVIAHQDPGFKNWLDTEGRNFGFIYWRFLLPTDAVEEIKTEVVNFKDIDKYLPDL
jgi:hypothetical protein